jgi:PleD family two-component response regulator
MRGQNLMTRRIMLMTNSTSQGQRIQAVLQYVNLSVQVVCSEQICPDALPCKSPPTAIILAGTYTDMQHHRLCHILKTNPITAHVPVIVLVPPDLMESTSTVCVVEADDYIRNDMFVEHNLVAALRSLDTVQPRDTLLSAAQNESPPETDGHT